MSDTLDLPQQSAAELRDSVPAYEDLPRGDVASLGTPVPFDFDTAFGSGRLGNEKDDAELELDSFLAEVAADAASDRRRQLK